MSEDVIRLVKERKIKELDKLEVINARHIICELRNDLEDLEFFFSWFVKWCGGYIPGAGSYHYEGILDNKTFDIYKKYEFDACNLCGDVITEEQWKYVLEIGYVTQEEYDDRCA